MLKIKFLQGTRSALYANDRESITVTVQEVTPRSVGALIALYERAVGIYASIVNINAYHQPGKTYDLFSLCYRIFLDFSRTTKILNFFTLSCTVVSALCRCGSMSTAN